MMPLTVASTPPEESGYLSHLGLSCNPFPVVPDESSIFLSGRIEQIVAEIVHGISARKGFMILTGDIGLGKTTISRRVISILEQQGIETALVLHTSLQDAELLREINLDFGIKDPDDSGKSASLGEQLRQLNQFLIERNRQGKNCAIIIDDAQNLNRQSLELVRMISNLEGGRRKLVQILLIGQPELAELLQTHELRQLRSRVVINAEAKPMSRKELKAYLQFKLNMAGNQGQVLVSGWAVHLIYHYTRGNFRMVNLIMDRCLYAICLLNLREITWQVVRAAYKDLFADTASGAIRRCVIAATVAALLSIAVWLGFGDVLTVERLTAGRHLFSQRSAEQTAADPTKAAENALPDFEAPKNSEAQAVTLFLQPLGLVHLAGKFQAALAEARMDLLGEEVFKESGYRLIELDHLTESIRRDFGVLSVPRLSDGAKLFYVLWRPPIEIKSFYYHYRGNEIHFLQALLAKVNLYDDKPDATVGPRLMQAVVTFQKIKGLPVTGFPDPKTLFFLCHA